jgi:hypothetical protein
MIIQALIILNVLLNLIIHDTNDFFLLARFVRKNETSAIPQPVNQGAPPVAVAMPATQVSQMVVDSRQQRPITDQVPPASGVCTQQAAATSFEQHLIQGQVC